MRRLLLRCAVRAGDAQISQEARHLVGGSTQDRWRGEGFRLSGGRKRSFALGQVRTSMRLHRTNRVMLMIHSDCGAYGGLQAFEGNEEREAANHESELRSAAEFLKSNISAIDVECYYLKFNGVWELEGV